MKETQYIIDGNTVTCTVFNENGVSFMATTQAVDGDLPAAMAFTLARAEKTRDEYETSTGINQNEQNI
ncbi:hypothetical protein NWT83_06030 [Klebsiella quasipneumoniae]|uniref:hypothetical protein n=1 Tax=Klebsiella quasipneumoniae TaxID=1463165 RepID=UPI00112B23CB|nr:hypothetical protein [Klebsiella quasipneumoniae]QER53229.1 hypothetical protein F2980_08800 [Klebsiella quasipneumoniae subsp. quasipneumoniae]TPB66669.1 hypothetical protein EC587_16325 [Klebsiella quasipneumoniae subsp. quasipneumoniae]UVG27091.1 hypothetical protein NWT83_06030 [Klebsiella quasipneumoniae]UVG32107.1 hypothetical protein NWT71_06030 [Klebsiella quasipneumoniae]